LFSCTRVRAHKEGEGYNTQERNEAAGKKRKANERTNLAGQGWQTQASKREKERGEAEGRRRRRMGKRA